MHLQMNESFTELKNPIVIFFGGSGKKSTTAYEVGDRK